MVTEISGAGFSHSVLTHLGATAAQNVIGAVRPSNGASLSTDVRNDKQITSSTQVAGSYAQLIGRQDELKLAASVVREVDNTMEQTSQLLDKIEDKLGEIVKMYPPYPVDSPQRISLLNNIDGLRKQIDALTFPPEKDVEDLVHLIGAKTDAANRNGDTSVSADAITLLKEQIGEVPGLDPSSASDEEVAKAYEQVKAAQNSLHELQAGMWKDVVSFVNQAFSSEAQKEASGVRGQIANMGIRGIGTNLQQLVQAVESS